MEANIYEKVIKKPNFTNKQAIENLKMVKRYGISFNVFNIVGFPEETEEMIFKLSMSIIPLSHLIVR